MRTKLKSIADKLGISISQVSRALANKNGVRESLRLKILNEAHTSGYKNQSGKHTMKAAIVSGFANVDSMNIAKRLFNKFTRKKHRTFLLFPESISFLESYRVDKILAIQLNENDTSRLRCLSEKHGYLLEIL